MFELIFKYKDEEFTKSIIFEDIDSLYEFVKKEKNIEVKKVIDKQSNLN